MANEMTLKEKAQRLVKIEGQAAVGNGRRTYAYDVAQSYLAQEKEIERMKSKLAKVREALEFYADDRNVRITKIGSTETHLGEKAVEKYDEPNDFGKKARQALAEIDGGKGGE